ncbi:hemerythrin domain-containing protein [Phytomonospora sp. NPDC050363]|uniref:hemerythrin domain-containing protein n=1 Tax=Phytomonospora sp. NPDC050363 TaxID=3155642 RepID=UPI00340A2D9A
MDAVTAITADHRLLEDLVRQVRSANGDETVLLAEIEARLAAHSRAEEDHVYPALMPGEPVYHGSHEHDEVAVKLAEAQRLLGTERFAVAFEGFVEAVRDHVEEGQEILPVLADAVSPARLEDLGNAFEERRVAELRGAGIDEPTP